MGCTPNAATCLGTRLRWDICGYARWVDCLELGATGCDVDRCTFP